MESKATSEKNIICNWGEKNGSSVVSGQVRILPRTPDKTNNALLIAPSFPCLEFIQFSRSHLLLSYLVQVIINLSSDCHNILSIFCFPIFCFFRLPVGAPGTHPISHSFSVLWQIWWCSMSKETPVTVPLRFRLYEVYFKFYLKLITTLLKYFRIGMLYGPPKVTWKVKYIRYWVSESPACELSLGSPTLGPPEMVQSSLWEVN